MPERPFAYVCSPFRGDMEENTHRAREYARRVFDAGYCPLAPHLLFPQFLSEQSPAERQAGLEMGLALLAQCRLVAVCGGDISSGMALEIGEARRLGIHIFDLAELPPAPALTAPSKTSLREKIAAGSHRPMPGIHPKDDPCPQL